MVLIENLGQQLNEVEEDRSERLRQLVTAKERLQAVEKYLSKFPIKILQKLKIL